MMKINLGASVKALTVLGLLLATVGGTIGSATAQTLCADEPVLGAADSNGDGIATADEILALAPDNPELQSVVGQLQGAGYTGIQYTGCDPSTGGTDTGGGSGTGTDGGATGGTGAGSGTGGDSGQNGAGTGTTGGPDSTGGTGQDGTGAPVAGQAGESTLTGPDGEPIVLLPSTGDGGASHSSMEEDAQRILIAGLGVLGLLSLILFLWSRTWRRA